MYESVHWASSLVIKENLGIQDKGATEWMETNQVSFPERGGMVCWEIVGKENIPGCKIAAGFGWSSESQSHPPW